MKKTVLAAGMAIWIIIAGLLVWFLIANLRGGYADVFRIPLGEQISMELIKEEEASLAGITNLAVEGSWQDIKFRASDVDSIRVLQYGAQNTAEDLLFKISREGGVLRITVNHNLRFNWGLNIAREEIVIFIPAAWAGRVNASASSGDIRLEEDFNWGDVYLNTSSGDIRLAGIDCDRLSIETSSGTVKTESGIRARGDIGIGTSSGSLQLAGEIRGQNIKFTCSSGDISTEGEIVSAEFNASTLSGRVRLHNYLIAESVKFSTTSGDIRANKIMTSAYDIQANSGNIGIEGLSGGGLLKSSSGDINAVLLAPVGDIAAESSSGRLRLTLPADLSFTFDSKTSSGNIKTDYEMLYKDSHGKEATASVGSYPTAHIRVFTSSGDIFINRGI
jgi:DUF4097 and DUF4098 domain-containing protein YvlB